MINIAGGGKNDSPKLREQGLLIRHCETKYWMIQSIHLNNISRMSLHLGPNELGSLVTTGTTLISPCFPEAWTEITVLTTTDSLVYKLRKNRYIASNSLRRRCLQFKWQTTLSTLSHTLYTSQLLPDITNATRWKDPTTRPCVLFLTKQTLFLSRFCQSISAHPVFGA